MNIAALPSAMAAMHTARTPEASEGPGPDHDGDADDKGVSSTAGASAAPPKGMGVSVDTKA
ncbi:MAG: hypothetical protein KGI68_12230 [Alphaproteobacteria bacterium]|nr:hypothetical protein [Alphaproteobacteria bacterium]MDE1985198.1 hypothetical protein [Alphaproteobacteria bacterium]MDE2162537.1 hypothetical protein [Alphaproteobacteria bacterium]MDE2265889.1 hypothetical protein [Alphaproteobacteria bacterium]MDE2499275.1 hypothetical protein [Alphaproteobacteria bacterium]